jgi:hypothetical protein
MRRCLRGRERDPEAAAESGLSEQCLGIGDGLWGASLHPASWALIEVGIPHPVDLRVGERLEPGYCANAGEATAATTHAPAATPIDRRLEMPQSWVFVEASLRVRPRRSQAV